MLLDACQSFCVALGDTLGPRAAEWVAIAGAMALGWWKARQLKLVAQSSVQAANEQATKAKVEARQLRLEVAEIRGSMRSPSMLPGPLPVIIPPATALHGEQTAADVYAQELREQAAQVAARELAQPSRAAMDALAEAQAEERDTKP